MTNDMPTKFERSLIFIVVISSVTILAVYEIFFVLPWILSEPIDAIAGKFLYLSNISDPDNPSVGVWLEIVLYKDYHIKYGNPYFEISIYKDEKPEAIKLNINNTVNKKGNLTIVHQDLNNDSLISSYDRFHIW